MSALTIASEITASPELIAFVAALSAFVFVNSHTGKMGGQLHSLTSRQIFRLELERIRALRMFFSLASVCVLAAIVLAWITR